MIHMQTNKDRLYDYIRTALYIGILVKIYELLLTLAPRFLHTYIIAYFTTLVNTFFILEVVFVFPYTYSIAYLVLIVKALFQVRLIFTICFTILIC